MLENFFAQCFCLNCFHSLPINLCMNCQMHQHNVIIVTFASTKLSPLSSLHNEIVPALIIAPTKLSPLKSLHQQNCNCCHHCINKIVSIASAKLSLLEYLAIITFLFIHFHIVIHLHRPPKEVYDVIYNSVSTLMSPNITKS